MVASVDGVHECAVIGAAGEGGLTELVACVVGVSGEADALRERIERACADGLPRFKRPKRLAFLESLPRTATGKLQRFALHEKIGVRPAHGLTERCGQDP